MLLNSLHSYADHDNAGRAIVINEWEKVKDQLEQVALDYRFYQKHGYLPTDESKEQNLKSLAEMKLAIKSIQDKIALRNSRMKTAIKEATKDNYREEIIQLRLEEKRLKDQLKLMQA